MEPLTRLGVLPRELFQSKDAAADDDAGGVRSIARIQGWVGRRIDRSYRLQPQFNALLASPITENGARYRCKRTA
jgi:hypothetical protein